MYGTAYSIYNIDIICGQYFVCPYQTVAVSQFSGRLQRKWPRLRQPNQNETVWSTADLCICRHQRVPPLSTLSSNGAAVAYGLKVRQRRAMNPGIGRAVGSTHWIAGCSVLRNGTAESHHCDAISLQM